MLFSATGAQAVTVTVNTAQPVDVILCTGWTQFDTADFEERLGNALVAEGLDSSRFRIRRDESVSTSMALHDYSRIMDYFHTFGGDLFPPVVLGEYGTLMGPGWRKGEGREWPLYVRDPDGVWRYGFMQGPLHMLMSNDEGSGSTSLSLGLVNGGYKTLVAPKIEYHSGILRGYLIEVMAGHHSVSISVPGVTEGGLGMRLNCQDDPYINLYWLDNESASRIQYLSSLKDMGVIQVGEVEYAAYGEAEWWHLGRVTNFDINGNARGYDLVPVATSPKFHYNCLLTGSEIRTVYPTGTMIVPGKPLEMTFTQDVDKIQVFNGEDLVFEYEIPEAHRIDTGYCWWGYGYIYRNGIYDIQWKYNNGNNLIDVTRNPTYQRDSIKFVVDLADRQREDFDDPAQIGELAQRFAANDLAYIGWGLDASKDYMQKFIQLCEGNGVYFDNQATDVYKETAKWIAGQVKKSLDGEQVLLVKDREYRFTVS